MNGVDWLLEYKMGSQRDDYLTGDAAFAVDRNGVIVTWNSAAEKLFRYSADRALGKRCWELLDGQDTYGNQYCCEHCPLREMAMRHESVNSFQASFKVALNGRKTLEVNNLSLLDRSGNGLLLHIFHSNDDTPAYFETNHSAPKPSTDTQIGILTSRETEVLTLLGEGLTTREIASSLSIGYATVRNHIQNTLHKLHVHNRLEAVVMSQRFNLI